MGRSIDDYRKKRDFGRTPEPAPGARGAGASGDRPVFVVHRHEARNLHYDLRLEMEGVLRSFAVPRGFSYDPTEKRLAVRTEDHPLAYEAFDGRIPKGEYGGGTMTIWDRGHYALVPGHGDTPEAELEKGELKLLLFGRRLRGEWHLVQTRAKEGHWLLFKSRDRFAGPPRDSALGVDVEAAKSGPWPSRVRPQEAGEERAPFSDPEFVFEAELEGRRVFLERLGSEWRLRGLRTSAALRKRLFALDRAVESLRAERALLDGVLTVHDEHGRPSRAALERHLSGEEPGELVFYAFDLPFWEELDLRPLPLLQRKLALRRVLPERGALLFVDHVAGEGEELARSASAAGIEALIAKRGDERYAAGKISSWVRVPLETSAEARASSLGAAPEGSGARQARSRRRTRFTNLGKVFWPELGLTKGDLIDHVDAVAEFLLPHLRDRPLHLLRYPDGIDGKSFYQKDARRLVPDWVPTIELPTGARDEPIRYVLCQDRDVLLTCANLGSIDLHPWFSRTGSLDSPDWVVIDLDPKEAPFAWVVQVARAAGRLLRGIGLTPFLKTSGKTGLHVFVPIAEGYTYDQTLLFAEAVARCLVRELPDVATVERNPARRGGRVYVDFGQNRRGQTVVPPYVPRPVQAASVSTPLEWDELERDLSPERWHVRNIGARLDEVGDLFRGVLDQRQDLGPAIVELERMVKEDGNAGSRG